MVIVEGDVQLVSESIDNRGADTKTGEGARARHKSDGGEVRPGFVVFL